MIRILKNYYHLFQAFIAHLQYGFPQKKLFIIGVTGTDGKTTTTNLIYHILNENKYPVGMISTVSAKIGDEDIDTGFHVTSPDPFLLNKLLKKMVDKGMKYAVIEATSHGLDQNRFAGIQFKIAVLTNITHEHLDYHKTYEHYVKSKSRLFKHSDIAILNKDDQSYDKVQKYIKPSTRIISYSLENKPPYISPLPGDYNEQNTLAAALVCEQLGIAPALITSALKTFPGVIGRLDEINIGQSFRAIVDFAHTPNALEQVLKTLKSQLKNKGRLIVVFGSAGLRDRSKRSKMGQAAGYYADFAVLTAEDPRTEDVNEIIQEIASGISDKTKYHIEPDRGTAIMYALQMAKKDDIVVVTGKGHEKSMCFGTVEYPWSDKEEIIKGLKKLITSSTEK